MNASAGRAPSLALIAAVTAIGFCALHMVVPTLPLLVVAFDDSPARVQLVLTLYLVGIAVGQLVYGPLSDRFGRRPVLIVGLTIFLAGTVLCWFAWSLSTLILGRVLEAGGACAGVVLGRAIIRDVYDRDAAARGLAMVSIAMTLGSAASPAVGAFLTQWFDWRAIFVALGGVGAIVWCLTVARLGETNVHRAPLDLAGMARSYAMLMRSPTFLGIAACSAGTSASWFTFTASAPYLLSELMHEPPTTYGLMILLPMATYMLGSAIAVRFAVRLGSNQLCLAGLALSLVASAMMVPWCAIALSPWALFIPLGLASIGHGLSQPPALAAGLSVFPHIAGAASGLMGFLQMTVAASGTFIVALLPYDSAMPTVLTVTGFAALATLFGWLVLGRPLSGRAAVPRPTAQSHSRAGPAPADGG
jgi:DHA1 family bicyclomycin/chloramphenicol resistance-like MFS transporter